jgi:putative FmdB family regulatory protein
MPTYDYQCAKCGEDIEVWQSFSEEPLTKHKGCGGKLTKVLSPVGIVLKGSGFYKTDSRNSSKKSSSTSTSESKSEKSESKSESSSSSDSGSTKKSDKSDKKSSSSSEAKSA